MNKMLFPEWRTHVNLDRATYDKYHQMFEWLKLHHMVGYTIHEEVPDLCTGMIWRMLPIFTQDVTHVLCRDADSLTTYREALAVQAWLETGQACLALHDNPGHGGLMGGMVGFDTAQLKALTGTYSWEEMISGYDLSQRGSDQHLMNQRILPKVNMNVKFVKENELAGKYSDKYLPGVDRKLWESNLCIAFIGAAGVNEMETIRFFTRFDPYQWAWIEIERMYPHLFPHHI